MRILIEKSCETSARVQVWNSIRQLMEALIQMSDGCVNALNTFLKLREQSYENFISCMV